jgi:hypothetical protein
VLPFFEQRSGLNQRGHHQTRQQHNDLFHEISCC